MPDVERVKKVINGLEDSLANNGCGFMDGVGELFAVSGEDLQNALALLKAQEPVEPKKLMEKSKNGYRWRFYCGKCGDEIDRLDKYCRHCGRAVKWY